jgi:hypothetical protein
MGAVAAVEVAIGLFFGLIAARLNVFVGARCARIRKLDGQDCAIAIEPMADEATRSFKASGSVAIKSPSQVGGNGPRENLKGCPVKSLGGVLNALGPRWSGSGHGF